MTFSPPDTMERTPAFLSDYVDTLDLHLQWFAAEDEGRTFDPTERKLKEAREEGRVAKSNEIPAALVMLTGLGILWGFSSYYLTNFRELFQYYIYKASSVNEILAQNEGMLIFQFIMRLLLPITLGVFLVAIFGNVVQFGVLFSVKAIAPKWSKINLSIGKWLEKSLSKNGWYVLGMTLFKIFIISSVLYLNFRARFNDFIGFSSHSFQENVGYIARLIGSIFIQSGIVLFILAILDFRFQSYMFKEQLKMGKEELKKEFKETEGDPEVKRRIKSRMQEYLNRNIPDQVKESDVVVTNPTHFAVAMSYEMNSGDPPQITAKGSDLIARRIRNLAEEHDVPVIENKPLARALYSELEVGDFIPEKYFRAVVLVFREVYKLKGIKVNE